MTTIDSGEAVETMKELKRYKRIAAWGVSAGAVEVALSAILHGADLIELAYNAFIARDLHRMAGDIAQAETGVLARSVLAHGLLTGHWSPEREFYPGDHRMERWTRDELRRRLSQLDALRPAVGGQIPTLRAVALRFVLSNQLVSSAVLGPRSVAQLDQLIREGGSGPPYLRDTALAELSTRLRSMGLLD